MAAKRGAPRGLDRAVRGPAGWLLDLDGVLTDTAAAHVEAWKTVFDPFLASAGVGPPADRPFDPVHDYVTYVDGKPHDVGVRDFLTSRGIVLAARSTDPGDGGQSVADLARAKDDLYLRLLKEKGVKVFNDAVALLDALDAMGRRCAVVSASENCTAVLTAAGIHDRFDARVDGIVAKEHHLKGKPAPDTYLFAAATLGVPPADAVVVEDAVAGVVAGRAGRFGLVVGVARIAAPEELRDAGADIVVGDLEQLLAPEDEADRADVPDAAGKAVP